MRGRRDLILKKVSILLSFIDGIYALGLAYQIFLGRALFRFRNLGDSMLLELAAAAELKLLAVPSHDLATDIAKTLAAVSGMRIAGQELVAAVG